jgi:hypothetical protein
MKASKDPKTIKQGTAGKRKRVTSTIPQKLEITADVKSEVWLWLHTLFNHQLSIIQRKEG